MNILLEPFHTPHGTFPFSKIKNEDFLPALDKAIEWGRAEVDAITENPEAANFQNTILALEVSGKHVSRISTLFYNLNSAETSDEIQKLAQEISPKLSKHGNDILLNEKLFDRIRFVYEHQDQWVLSAEARRLIQKTYKSFARNGALLGAEEKETLRKLDEQLSLLSLTFGENVLAENNAYQLVLQNETDLDGLPAYAIQAAKHLAEERGLPDAWVITLDYPSYIPFMTYANNRALREELFKAFGSKAFKGNERDNQAVVRQLADLRRQRAQLLGYASHAHFVLEERMAESPQKVFDFLKELQSASLPFGQKDLAELQAYAESLGFAEKMARWDVSYFSEKLKKERYNIDDELLKPYFKLENVIEGVFQTAHKLYGLNFVPATDIEVYHPEVQAYTVWNDEGQFIGVFYADYFPRKGKRQGAWMTSFQNQSVQEQVNIRPHVSIVCNFTKPVGDKPSLLTFNEVTTLFHEFGHALHGLLANAQYETLSGTHVSWDFVELPSQIFENWCYEKECLELFATHYETGELIPAEYIERIKASANFQSGMMTLRQLSFGLLDMAWHGKSDSYAAIDVNQFEKDATSGTDLMPKIEGTNSSCSFSHIFQGGYSAGYYSYKWAEVLEASAFEVFLDKGIFDRETAISFKDNILSKGDTEHPMTLFKRFAGKEPSVQALLKKAGLV